MRHECRITVLETKVFPELQRQYPAETDVLCEKKEENPQTGPHRVLSVLSSGRGFMFGS